MDNDKKNYEEENNEKTTAYNPLGQEDERSYGQNNINEDDVKKIIKTEIKNSKPKTPWLQIVAIALLFSILSSGVTAIAINASFNRQYNPGGGKASTYNISTKGDVNVETAVAAKATPSVVGIQTAVATNSYFSQSGYVEGVGSGVIVSEDGYILTNSHVVSNGQAEKIAVVFENKEKAPGKLIWYDESLDLAVVKVEVKGLTPIEFGDSDKVVVGDKAIAIGNPLGLDLQSTLTSGYISGLNRTINLENGSSMDGLMQTDASINSGNSGGALLNEKGELIGINTAKASQGEGIGFAIPINIAKTIVESIKENGEFETVLLGIQGIDLDVFEEYFEVDTGAENGAVVRKVEEKSPAAKAGIEPSDVITKIDSKEVSGMDEIRKMLLNFKIGDTVKVEIMRDGESKTLDLTFEKFEVSEPTEAPENEEDQNKDNQQEINPWKEFERNK